MKSLYSEVVESVNVVGTMHLYKVVHSWHYTSLGFNYVVSQMKCKQMHAACYILLFISIFLGSWSGFF